MKLRHKPRPVCIYREETKNELGEWVCSRMTYDKAQYESWRKSYKTWLPKLPSWVREHRFVRGWVQWEEDPN